MNMSGLASITTCKAGPSPLKSPDPEIRIDLGRAFHDAVSLGDYDESISYREEPPLPAFSDEDREWLQGILAC